MLMAVRVIPARKTAAVGKAKQLRVAAYCRVSTDMDEQESSYEAQVSHYTAYISAHPGWVSAGIYADEGISGTSVQRRARFMQMITDCENGLIDLVITKSISRFARNTLDCLNYIRKLKDLGIPIIFEKENINTLDARGELLITIMASIAQQESQSISANVRMGIQYRFQQGHVMLSHTTFLGYTKERGKKLTIVPEEAAVVRRIYREFLEGYSYQQICSGLEKDGIKSPAGRDKWYGTTVQSILSNEKYMGDLLLQKYYTTDFLTKKHAQNKGKFPQYYVENAHDPIVPREVFFNAQGEILRRRRLLDEADGKHVVVMRLQPLSQIIECGKCGANYKRFMDRGTARWKCRGHIHGECDAESVNEDLLHHLVLSSFQDAPDYKDEVIRRREDLLHGEISRCQSQIDEISEQIDKLTDQIDQDESRAADMAEPLKQLRLKRRDLQTEKAVYSDQEMQMHSFLELIDICEGKSLPQPLDRDACTDYEDFFARTRKVTQPIREYHDEYVQYYIRRITVYDDRLVILFKAGVEIEKAIPSRRHAKTI